MILRHATHVDIPNMRSLWISCFGDDDAYIDQFFSDLFRQEHSYVVEMDGRVRCMVFTIPSQFHTPTGTLSCHYLYAMAVEPVYQGRGLGQTLLAYVESCLRYDGVDAIALKPADMELFRFYEKAGYETAFYCREVTATPRANGSVCEVTAEQYGSLHEYLLADIPHLEHSESLLAHQGNLGMLLQITYDGMTACAAVERNEEMWTIKELLAPSETTATALGILCHHFGVNSISAKCPAYDRNGSPFGMLLQIHNKTDCPKHSYLGLALD